MEKTMKRSKYVAFVEKYGREFNLSNALIFDLSRLGAAYFKLLINDRYVIELDKVLDKIGVWLM